MDIYIIDSPITLTRLQEIADERYGDMVKAVVDVERRIMTVGGEFHADEELELLELGSKQSDLWGVNVYPARPRDSWVEFDSMINLRPSQGNRSRGVGDQTVREKIIAVVDELVQAI